MLFIYPTRLNRWYRIPFYFCALLFSLLWMIASLPAMAYSISGTKQENKILHKFQACLQPELQKQSAQSPHLNSKEPYLNVYGWSGYFPKAVLDAFTKETGIRVNYSTYDSNETLYAKLIAKANSGYDVIVPSSYFVERMLKNDMLQKLDKAQLSHFKHLDSALLNKPYDPENHYSIPYLWSSTGIIVNTRQHKIHLDQLHSWESLWNAQFTSKLLLLDDAREVFAIALLALDLSPNTQNPEHIKAAYLKLRQLIPNIRVFSSDGVSALYVDEDLTLGMGWNGDAARIHKENKAINFIYPKEGFMLSIDGFAIPRRAPHVKLAHQFIDFMLRPEIAAQVSMATGYPSANQSAQQYLSIKENSIIYPDHTLLAQGIILQDVGNQVGLYEQYWQLLKIN